MTDINLETLLDRIYCATEEELDPIIKAVTERFGEVFQEWELMILSVHGHDNKSHIEALQKSMDILKSRE